MMPFNFPGQDTGGAFSGLREEKPYRPATRKSYRPNKPVDPDEPTIRTTPRRELLIREARERYNINRYHSPHPFTMP